MYNESADKINILRKDDTNEKNACITYYIID